MLINFLKSTLEGENKEKVNVVSFVKLLFDKGDNKDSIVHSGIHNEIPINFINSDTKDILMELVDNSVKCDGNSSMIILPEVIDIQQIDKLTEVNVDLETVTNNVNSIPVEINSTDNKSSSDCNKMQNSVVESESDTDLQSLTIIDSIKELTKSTTKRGDFKIAAMRILLTYQGAKLNKVDLLEHINNITKGKIIEEYVIVHDNCEKDFMYHTHIYIKFNKTFQSVNRNFFNFTQLQPNVERVLHKQIFIIKVLKYLFERDMEPYTNLEASKIQLIKEKIAKSSSTSSDVFTISESISKDDASIKESYYDNRIPIASWNFKPWQRFLLNVLSGKVDKNLFYWCLEPSDFTEKTELTKYIVSNYEHTLVINKINNVIDMYLETIKLFPVEIVIFDLSWKLSNLLTTSENSDIFEFIEMLKTSYIPKVSFQNGGLILKPCHVIIFSYCLEGIKEINPNRWKIIKILEDGEAYLGHVTRQSEVEYDDIHILV